MIGWRRGIVAKEFLIRLEIEINSRQKLEPLSRATMTVVLVDVVSRRRIPLDRARRRSIFLTAVERVPV